MKLPARNSSRGRLFRLLTYLGGAMWLLSWPVNYFFPQSPVGFVLFVSAYPILWAAYNVATLES